MGYVATLGGFLRSELQRRDWSPEEFARRCDPPISTTLAYQILNGKDNVKRSTFGAIASALGLTPVELMAAIGDDAGGVPDLSPKLALLNALLRHASDEELEQVHDFARWKVQPAQRRANPRLDETAKRLRAAERKLKSRPGGGDDDGSNSSIINASHHAGALVARRHLPISDVYPPVVTAGYVTDGR
jgi:transcriptional regulator with XRE-family HTH domain